MPSEPPSFGRQLASADCVGKAPAPARQLEPPAEGPRLDLESALVLRRTQKAGEHANAAAMLDQPDREGALTDKNRLVDRSRALGRPTHEAGRDHYDSDVQA